MSPSARRFPIGGILSPRPIPVPAADGSAGWAESGSQSAGGRRTPLEEEEEKGASFGGRSWGSSSAAPPLILWAAAHLLLLDCAGSTSHSLTWTAADTEAQATKRKWDADLAWNQRNKAYLEEIYIEWLQRFLDYGKETLLRTEAPVVKVTRKADYDSQETLVCQVHGFYPKEIDANWVKDGEVWQEGTSRGLVAPNSDGTYYVLLSVKIDPEERDRFRCRVEHDSLEKPLDVAWEKEPGKQSEKLAYKAASTSDQGSASSARGSDQTSCHGAHIPLERGVWTHHSMALRCGCIIPTPSV
ncbi:antigen-presenting glycoprotein CD1d-like isoform X2 [Zootoca vivipara]|uniref:antigen-presenting glycoprotein CD1d-like isoform X2 n=1 Tax=Zootoca vivipara TaxID=8524 RepID=UPI00293BFA14|nr:antigen-presenting glycoprotein CD1d-like isoform X2 [Zootoca vivipara]